MAGKTRVLVTHQLQYIPQADYIVFLKDGRVKEVGHYEHLMKNDGEFAALFRQHGGGDNTAQAEEKEGEETSTAVINTDGKPAVSGKGTRC